MAEQPVKNKNGCLLTNTKAQLERWKERFQELPNRPVPSESPDIPAMKAPLDINTSRPSKAEIKTAIKHLRNGKAAESITSDIQTSVEMLYNLFRKIWETENVPSEWKHITELPKKGDFKDCKNWRGITLLSVPSKVFNKMLLERMKTAVDGRLRDEQAGFRSDRSCTVHIATLRIILEQSI